MAFPNDIDTFIEARDIEQSDTNNLNGYQTAMRNGDYARASQFLSQMADGVKKQFNASRFNELVSVIASIEEFYLSLDGVRKYIDNEINKYTDISGWLGTINYEVGNLVIIDDTWYVCKVANINQNPLTTTGYWQILIAPKEAKQYYIGNNPQPTGVVGRIVFDTNV